MHSQHPGQPGERGPDPTVARDDSHKTTPATDMQADDACAADTPPADTRQPPAEPPPADRAAKQQPRTDHGR